MTAKVKDRTQNDMKRFYASLDIAVLWEEFYTAVKPSGKLKYVSVRAFILAKSVYVRKPAAKKTVVIGDVERAPFTKEQQRFLAWVWGPKEPVDAECAAEFPFAEPLDWEEKRRNGGWFSDSALKQYGKDIRSKLDALAALQAAGNGITINSLMRMERLAQRLDDEFGGNFFVDGLTLKQNEERAKLYLSLHKQLLSMIDHAQDIYAKSHGINFHDMSGFEHLLAAQVLHNNARGINGATQSRSDKILGQILEMTLEKGATYNAPIPDEITEKVVMMSTTAKPGKAPLKN